MPYKRRRKYNKKKHNIKGGTQPSTDGSFGTLITNVVALAKQTISTVSSTSDLIKYVMNIDSTLNQPYSPNETNAPGNNLSTT